MKILRYIFAIFFIAIINVGIRLYREEDKPISQVHFEEALEKAKALVEKETPNNEVIKLSCADFGQVKKLFSLPIKVAEGINLTDIKCENNNIFYLYQMNDYFGETSKTQMNWKEFSNTFSKEELYDLKNVVIQDFCKAFKDNDIAIKSILENFSQIILRYNLPDNTLWFDVFVSKNSCK